MSVLAAVVAGVGVVVAQAPGEPSLFTWGLVLLGMLTFAAVMLAIKSARLDPGPEVVAPSPGAAERAPAGTRDARPRDGDILDPLRPKPAEPTPAPVVPLATPPRAAAEPGALVPHAAPAERAPVAVIAPDSGLDREAPIRIMMFVDWANFMQRWLGSPGMRTVALDQARASWQRLPHDLIDVLEASPELAGGNNSARFAFVGAHVYDSFITDTDLLLGGITQEEKMRRYRGRERWMLETQIATLPGFHVHIADRKVDKQGRGLEARPKKNERGFIESEEKEVDTALVADMFRFAAFDHYDAILLLSDDRDYRPAVRGVQEIWGKKVIHVGFSNTPILRTVCWSHISLDEEDDEEAESGTASVPPPPAASGDGAAAADPPPARARLGVGQLYRGKVNSVTAHGAWVDLPEQGRYGYVNVRNVRLKPGGDLLHELAKGQDVWVKFIGVDEGRRIQLSMKAVDQETGTEIPRG